MVTSETSKPRRPRGISSEHRVRGRVRLNVISILDFGCAPRDLTPIKTPARGEAGVMMPSVGASRLGRIGPGPADSASWRTEKLLCLALRRFWLD